MRILFLFSTLVLSGELALSQQLGSSGFYSAVDQSLTIKSLYIYPVSDNADGIYARPMETLIKDVLGSNHHFDVLQPAAVSTNYSSADLFENKAAVMEVLNSSGADGLIVSRATKFPAGVDLDIFLFTKSEGKVLAKENIKNFAKFETSAIVAETKSALDRVMAQVPYSGLILSRNQNRVTVDLGKKDGISPGDVVSSILIIKENRHPKFDFLISTEKEVLGKIKLEKVEDTLSFGSVVTEKEVGAITVGSKISKLGSVDYKGGGYLAAPTDQDDLPSDVKKLTFGDNPKAWVPVDPPTFGSLGVSFGFGSFSANSDLESSGSVQSEESIFPQLKIDGELWITPDFSVLGGIRQGVVKIKNPLSGSEPETLNLSISEYSLLFGYNILVHGDFFGPKVQLLGGFSQYSRYVDTSNPLAMTSATYSGFMLGADGSMPVDPAEKIYLGANLQFFIAPGLKETPKTSGRESNSTINTFSFYSMYKMGERLRAKGSLDFELYSSTFSGSGTRNQDAQSASERIITFNGGLEYLF